MGQGSSADNSDGTSKLSLLKQASLGNDKHKDRKIQAGIFSGGQAATYRAH